MNYGKAIGGIIGTTLVVGAVGKYLLPANKKLFKQIKLKRSNKRK